MMLVRLRDQPIVSFKRERGDAFRSHNERLHFAMLEDMFPCDSWIVEHEPETATDLHGPSVVDGVAQELVELSSYTCDFLVVGRWNGVRFFVESKYDEGAVDEKALAKCRRLRDKTLTRVFLMAGKGRQVRWLDFGPPRRRKNVGAITCHSSNVQKIILI